MEYVPMYPRTSLISFPTLNLHARFPLPGTCYRQQPPNTHQNTYAPKDTHTHTHTRTYARSYSSRPWYPSRASSVAMYRSPVENHPAGMLAPGRPGSCSRRCTRYSTQRSAGSMWLSRWSVYDSRGARRGTDVGSDTSGDDCDSS